MRPFFTFWEGSLRGQYDLVCMKCLYHSLSMVEVELGEYIIEEKYDRQGEVPSYEENLELLEREEEDLVLSTREEEMTRLSMDRESEIIEMWSDVCMA